MGHQGGVSRLGLSHAPTLFLPDGADDIEAAIVPHLWKISAPTIPLKKIVSPYFGSLFFMHKFRYTHTRHFLDTVEDATKIKLRNDQ